MVKTIFVTGISTEVGKTVASAIITEALEADYWKPVQAGELDYTDSDKVRNWISNSKSVVHPTSYELNTPMSPHAAAEIDGVEIDLDKIRRPATENNLVIEGAGGLLVPLNDRDLIADLIRPDDHVLLVSRHYLGSINHTLLSVNELKARNLRIMGVLFIGDEHPSTESIITKITGLPVLGRIGIASKVDKEMVRSNAIMLREALKRAL